jgi:hypothetical protein
MNLRDRFARAIPVWVEHPNSELARAAERNVTFFYYFVVFIAATFRYRFDKPCTRENADCAAVADSLDDLRWGLLGIHLDSRNRPMSSSSYFRLFPKDLFSTRCFVRNRSFCNGLQLLETAENPRRHDPLSHESL